MAVDAKREHDTVPSYRVHWRQKAIMQLIMAHRPPSYGLGIRKVLLIIAHPLSA